MAGTLFPVYRADNSYFGGNYKVAGQTLRGGDAYRARVLLFPEASIIPIRDTWSAVDGSWVFLNLASGWYHVWAIDKTAERNAVTYSYVAAVAM